VHRMHWWSFKRCADVSHLQSLNRADPQWLVPTAPKDYPGGCGGTTGEPAATGPWDAACSKLGASSADQG